MTSPEITQAVAHHPKKERPPGPDRPGGRSFFAGTVLSVIIPPAEPDGFGFPSVYSSILPVF